MVFKEKVAKQYMEKELLSSSPEKIVLKLYNGAIGFIKSAIKNIEKDDIPAKAKLLDKAVNIIVYLRSCLDLEKGGSISDNLNKLYEFVLVELAEANLRNDSAKLEKALEILGNIRDGWEGICNNKNESNDQNLETVQQMSKNNKSTTIDQYDDSFTAVA